MRSLILDGLCARNPYYIAVPTRERERTASQKGDRQGRQQSTLLAEIYSRSLRLQFEMRVSRNAPSEGRGRELCDALEALFLVELNGTKGSLVGWVMELDFLKNTAGRCLFQLDEIYIESFMIDGMPMPSRQDLATRNLEPWTLLSLPKLFKYRSSRVLSCIQHASHKNRLCRVARGTTSFFLEAFGAEVGHFCCWSYPSSMGKRRNGFPGYSEDWNIHLHLMGLWP